jgi:hypothetical protein
MWEIVQPWEPDGNEFEYQYRKRCAGFLQRCATMWSAIHSLRRFCPRRIGENSTDGYSGTLRGLSSLAVG